MVDASKYTNKVSTNFVKIGDPETAEEGETVVDAVAGILEVKDKTQLSGGLVGKYTIEQEDETKVTFLGSVILDDLLAQVEIGTDVFIRFTGTEKSSTKGHSPTRQFEVLTA